MPALFAQRFPLLHALILAPLAENPGRTLLAVLAIALGVALGVGVHLVNGSAVAEFGLAARHLAGEADLVVRGSQAGFDEALYPRIARLPEVAGANPAIEAEARLAHRGDTLRVMGFDPLRAAQVQPALLPERSSLMGALLKGDSLLLSPEAAQWLGLGEGDPIALSVGTGSVSFQVAGLLPHEAYRQRIAVMDIAAAQWRFARLGRLNRIDIKLAAGVDAESFRRRLQAMLPPGVQASPPEMEAERTAALSRAYRVNLDMLALIALFTGAFLVFSSQVLALLRRRTQLALLRAMGVTRRALTARLVAEGAVIGMLGAGCGVALGFLLARYALTVVGPDLGAGYFHNVAATVRAEPHALAGFFGLGVLFATLGAAAPAWEAARRAPAQGLRAGDEEESLSRVSTTRWGSAALAASVPAALAPPISGLPVGGYLSIVLILLGSVLVMPRLAAAVLERLPAASRGPAAVATAQLKGTPRQAAISIAAIVISMSLMVSMMIMVASFRTSLDAWLGRMLPADLYLRVPGETGFLAPEEQMRIARAPGIEGAEFLRSQKILLEAERAPVTLIARAVDKGAAERTLPLAGPSIVPAPGAPPPAWVSEVAAELYNLGRGDIVALPIGSEALQFTVAGIWRDYARQNGAIVIDRGDYIAATGDRLANDAALWLAEGMSVLEAQRVLRDRLGDSDHIEISASRTVRAASLALFDRTFAITYALEAAAILVGLFGVGVSFSVQALARRREFGVLRHIGMTRGDIAAMLGTEGALITALGVVFGLATGWVVSLILVHVINRQSFHWTMELHVPWLPLAGLALLVVAAATATAVWSGRTAMKEHVVRAVREDW